MSPPASGLAHVRAVDWLALVVLAAVMLVATRDVLRAAAAFDPVHARYAVKKATTDRLDGLIDREHRERDRLTASLASIAREVAAAETDVKVRERVVADAVLRLDAAIDDRSARRRAFAAGQLNCSAAFAAAPIHAARLSRWARRRPADAAGPVESRVTRRQRSNLIVVALSVRRVPAALRPAHHDDGPAPLFAAEAAITSVLRESAAPPSRWDVLIVDDDDGVVCDRLGDSAVGRCLRGPEVPWEPAQRVNYALRAARADGYGAVAVFPLHLRAEDNRTATAVAAAGLSSSRAARSACEGSARRCTGLSLAAMDAAVAALDVGSRQAQPGPRSAGGTAAAAFAWVHRPLGVAVLSPQAVWHAAGEADVRLPTVALALEDLAVRCAFDARSVVLEMALDDSDDGGGPTDIVTAGDANELTRGVLHQRARADGTFAAPRRWGLLPDMLQSARSAVTRFGVANRLPQVHASSTTGRHLTENAEGTSGAPQSVHGLFNPFRGRTDGGGDHGAVSFEVKAPAAHPAEVVVDPPTAAYLEDRWIKSGGRNAHGPELVAVAAAGGLTLQSLALGSNNGVAAALAPVRPQSAATLFQPLASCYMHRVVVRARDLAVVSFVVAVTYVDNGDDSIRVGRKCFNGDLFRR